MWVTCFLKSWHGSHFHALETPHLYPSNSVLVPCRGGASCPDCTPSSYKTWGSCWCHRARCTQVFVTTGCPLAPGQSCPSGAESLKCSHLVLWDFTSFSLDLSVQCGRVSVPKRSLYLHLSAGLFEKHKLLFSFNMTIKIEQAEGRVPQDELDFFLKGNGACWLSPSSYPWAPRT